MKVSLISRSNGEGGAFIAANRLYNGLQDLSVDVSMIVGLTPNDNVNLVKPDTYPEKAWVRLSPIMDKLPMQFYKKSKKTVYSIQWLPDFTKRKIQQVKSDIFNLHWIGGGFMQIETLKKLQKPIVWTLHDMWPFTGGCHYSNNCQGYQQSCGKCPQLGSETQWDLSRWVWKRKKQNWSSLDLTVITPSHWLADCVRQSSLLQEFPIKVIPNGIDPQVYQPIDKKLARHLLSLPQDKKLIVFGSMNSTKDPRKGIHLLLDSLRYISNELQSKEIELVVFGSNSSEHSDSLGVKIHSLGKFKDDISLNIAYNTADLFIAPSLEDNLPNTVMEALACGIPCIAFKIGGMPDMIEHQVNGYLAQPDDVIDLAQGILWILEDSERWTKLSLAARQRVENDFTLQKQANAYHQLFQNLYS